MTSDSKLAPILLMRGEPHLYEKRMHALQTTSLEHYKDLSNKTQIV